ncbi:MAG: tetratricopeptide repeat protein [Planctomycetota bacterium]
MPPLTGDIHNANKVVVVENSDGDIYLFGHRPAREGDTTNFPAAKVKFNDGFVGRDDELAELHSRLGRGSVAVYHALSSDGGFGKTQVAVEYVKRHGTDYEGVWFVNALSAASAYEDGRDLLTALGEPVPEKADAVAAAVAAAVSRGRHLLILDDVQDLAVASAYALGSDARLLVTTRCHVYANEGFEPFALDVLKPEDAVKLLVQGRDDLDNDAERPALLDVVEFLHRHALAVALAAGYLRRNGDLCAAGLLAALRDAPVGGDEGLLGDVDPASVAAGYRRGVAATLTLHLPTLGKPADDDDRLRQRLLAAACLLAPRGIPRTLLLAAVSDVATARDARKQLTELASFSVLRPSAGDAATLEIHGLTQQIVKAKLVATNEGRQLLGRSAYTTRDHLLGVFNREANERGARGDALDRLSSHAESLVRQNLGRHVDTAWSHLCNQLAFFARRVHHRLADARELFEEAVRILKAAPASERGDLGTCVNNVGNVLQARGDLDGALAKYREAERIDRAAFGDDHPNVAIRLNNVGTVLQARADLDGALASYREAERIDRAAFGDDHPKVAIRVNNVGSVQEARGDLDGALSNYREAERIDRAAFGGDHPNVARDVNNIGYVLQARGDLDGALTSFREAERINRAAFGDDHPNVATDVNNIGMVLKARGDLDGALANFREAERIDRAAFGGDHPEVATDVNNIGMVLKVRGDLDGALANFREAERIDRAAFGDDHPSVAAAVNNVGSVLTARGDLDGARVTYKEAFRILLRANGPRGENVITAAGNFLAVGGDPVAIAREVAGGGGEEAAEVVRAELTATLPEEWKAKLAALEERQG